VKIGILQTGHTPEELVEEHGAYPDMFARLLDGHGFEFEVFAVVDGIFPDAPHAADGWLITGSKHGAYEDHAWIAPLEDFIRAVYDAGVPMVGICFGHQIMAQAMGGKVKKFDGIWGVGNRQYTNTDGETTTLLAMHQDQVVEAPPDATLSETSDYCRFAGFTYKGNAMSIQPHPEFSPQFIRKLIEQRAGKLIPHDQSDAALAGLDRENDSHKVAGQIAAFFKQSARAAA